MPVVAQFTFKIFLNEYLNILKYFEFCISILKNLTFKIFKIFESKF